MAIFAIIAVPGGNTANLPQAIARAYPEDFLQLSDGAWLVAAEGPARSVSDRIGITDPGPGGGREGNAVVIGIADYHGWAGSNVWSWIKAKWEATARAG